MRNHYELKRFRQHYVVFAGLFFVFVLGAGIWCSQYNVLKISVLMTVYMLYAAGVYVFFDRLFYGTLRDVEDISETMVEVLEGREDYTAELYKEGALGELYTNFYKMVSTLRESQMRTQEEKKFLQDTMSDISHQLKTPLASLNVFVDLLYEDKVPEEAGRKQILEEAQNQLDRMEWLVLSMLKLARLEAGAVSFQNGLCSAKEIAAQAAESVAYLTEARKQNIRIGGCVDGTLYCDKEWLTEALINLLKNASDYSPENTEINIEIEKNRLYTRLYVKDWGMGIPEEALPHIFERFYRVNREVNPNSVGIGLALTKSIVEGMNGRITVRSELGKSTCFMLTFLNTAQEN